MIPLILMGQFRRNISSAVFRNQMEDRVLRNKLGSIELEEKRSLRRFGSETRLLKIRQEQRLGSFICAKRNEVNGTHINKAWNSSPKSAVCRQCLHIFNILFEATLDEEVILNKSWVQ